jgi:hypothetical protein
MLTLLACVSLSLDPPVDHAYVVYDLSGGDIPLPNDLLVDQGTLDLPVDDPELSDAEVELRGILNTTSGWPTTSSIAVSLSHIPDEATLEGVEVWEWGAVPARLEVEPVLTGQDVEILPPETGWPRGAQLVVVVHDALKTSDGRAYGVDTGFWYLRQEQALDDPSHERAFPGDNREDRLATGVRLEELRRGLLSYFDHFENEGIEREQIGALWTFGVTQAVELEMDADSARVPLPFDLLIDPQTGLVDLPADEDDDALEADAKAVANTLDGFGLQANLMASTTDRIQDGEVELYRVDTTPEKLDLGLRVYEDRFLSMEPAQLPLEPGSTYAVVVRSMTAGDGSSVQPMTLNRLIMLDNPLAADGVSLVGGVEDDDALRLEGVRLQLDPLLDALGRDTVLAAWPFTTLDPVPGHAEAVNMAASLGVDPGLDIEWRRPAYHLWNDDALSELFPGTLNPADEFYIGRIWGVGEVVQGTIQSPSHLDPETRRWNDDYVLEDIKFLATIPTNPDPDKPILLFGHAIVTDRRFLLTVAGELALKGFTSVAIDWPYHGDRTACVEASLVAVPNFFPPALQALMGFEEDLIWLPPCESGDKASCGAYGECLDKNGNVEEFSTFPIIDMKPASGAAFMDMSDLPHIPDHFRQALVDMGALQHAIEEGAFTEVWGNDLPRDRFVYAGQSLGSIIGSVYVSQSPAVEAAVFNVLGADLVDLFQESTYFGPQIDAFMVEHELQDESWEQERLLNIAKWLVDSVDPQGISHLYAEDDRPMLIQIDRINDETGDLIIPNFTTEAFQRRSQIPMEEYASVLHADLIVPGVGDFMLEDMADFLDEQTP